MKDFLQMLATIVATVVALHLVQCEWHDGDFQFNIEVEKDETQKALP